MAEGEEKSYPATARRREDARKRGQVARSPEFGAAAILLALVVSLHVLLPQSVGQGLMEDMHAAFRFNPHAGAFGFDTVRQWQLLGLFWAARLLLPVLLLALVLGLCAGVGQVGFHITPEALAPQWSRLDPISGIKRLFALRGAVELLKGLAKMAIVGSLCYRTVADALQSGDLLRTMNMPLPLMLGTLGGLLWTLGLRVSMALLLLACADYAYQRYEHEKSLRMSFSEIKQEMKQSEGDPHIKGRIRRLQREMARRRMMQDVPKADVVVTNPTHYAVALQYERGAAAPRVIAKGQDEVARRIKEIAREHDVPLVENKPLAQTLHKGVEIGQEIPGELYEAVAQVLAFVFRTYGRRRA